MLPNNFCLYNKHPTSFSSQIWSTNVSYVLCVSEARRRLVLYCSFLLLNCSLHLDSMDRTRRIKTDHCSILHRAHEYITCHINVVVSIVMMEYWLPVSNSSRRNQKTHGSESRPCKVESARRNIMTRPLHVSILQEGTLWKFRLLLLAHRLRYCSETLYRCLICS